MDLVLLTFLLGFIVLAISVFYWNIRTRENNPRNKLELDQKKDEERKREEERKMNEKYEQEGNSVR